MQLDKFELQIIVSIKEKLSNLEKQVSECKNLLDSLILQEKNCYITLWTNKRPVKPSFKHVETKMSPFGPIHLFHPEKIEEFEPKKHIEWSIDYKNLIPIYDSLVYQKIKEYETYIQELKKYNLDYERPDFMYIRSESHKSI